jgi:type I restriction enzyme S subunit
MQSIRVLDNDIPVHWRWVQIQDVCEVNPWKPRGLERDPDAETCYLPMRAVDDVTGTITDPELRPFSKLKSGYTYFEEGDVLFAKITPSMENGKQAIARNLPGKFDFGFGSTEFHVLRPGPDVIAEWIHRFVRQPVVRKTAVRYFKGSSGHRRVPKEFVASLEIPLPPVDEQRQIMVRVDEVIEQIDAARTATAVQVEAAEALPDAYLREIFGSPEAEEWPTRRLGEVADIHAGLTKGRAKKDDLEYREMPYLRVANVQDGYLDLSEVKTIPASEEEIGECQLQYGDLLLTEGGDPDKLGRGTYWQNEISVCLHQNHIFRVRFDLDEFSPAYVSAQIGSRYGKKYFSSHAKKTTGIATINQTVLRNFPLKVLPFEKQSQIAEDYEEKKAATKQITEALEDQINAVDHLPASILRKAFRGQLLSTDRASELSIAK